MIYVLLLSCLYPYLGFMLNLTLNITPMYLTHECNKELEIELEDAVKATVRNTDIHGAEQSILT